MEKSKGKIYWDNIAGMFYGKDLDDEDFSFIDSMENQMKTDADKSIMRFFDILMENDEHKEPYFKNDLNVYVDQMYKGNTDAEAMKAIRNSRKR